MKRFVIPLAAVAAAAAAAAAHAQSSVTLFGVVDAAVEHASASGPGSSSITQLTNSGVPFLFLDRTARNSVRYFYSVVAFDVNSGNDNLFRAGRSFLGVPMLVAALLGIGIVVLSGRLAARTADGARTLAMAMAYRNTLRFEMAASKNVGEAVEKTRSRLPWITTPDLLTVWAVAFGLKDEIDHLIKQTFAQAQAAGVAGWSPAWYSGGSIDSVSSMVGSISTTSASSSGSGYGGGSSGGGGGAGGGF